MDYEMGFNRFHSAEAHDRSHEQGYYALQNAITVALIAVEIGQQRIGWRYLVDTGGNYPQSWDGLHIRACP